MAADGEQQQQQPLTARVPRQGAVAIQYPGYIASVDAALASLGGLEGLGRGLQERAGLLKLRLRPEDSHSHPLLGERQHVAGLVLRIARPRDQPGAPPSMTIAARVAQAHAFTGLADYQFLGDDGPWGGGRDASRLSARNEGGGAEPFGAGAARPLLLVPPLFSKVDAPLVFGFRDQAPSREPAAPGPPASGRPRVISFYEPHLPPGLPLPAPPAGAEAAAAREALVAALQAALAARPAWPHELLLAQLPPGSSPQQLQPLLAALCYQFKTGPWKGLWLACGWDPRAHPAARRYQLVSYRPPAEWRARVKAAKAAGQPMAQPPLVQLHSVAAMPVAHTSLLVLGDMALEAVGQLVDDAPLPPAASEAYGWFTYGSASQAQQAVSMAFNKLARRLLADAPPLPEPPQAAAAAAGEQQQQEQEAGEQAADDVAGQRAQPAHRRRRRQASGAAPGGAKQPAAAAAAAAAEPPDGERARPEGGADAATDLVGLLGLGEGDEALVQWLQQQAQAEANDDYGGGGGGADGGESSDGGGGLSDSDWATSAGETSVDEGSGAGDDEEFG